MHLHTLDQYSQWVTTICCTETFFQWTLLKQAKSFFLLIPLNSLSIAAMYFCLAYCTNNSRKQIQGHMLILFITKENPS